MTQSFALSRAERFAVFVLASVYALRLLGLFMVLPLLSLHAQNLEGATAWRVGLAMGLYGLSQALLQIPLGWCSDRFGRRPVVVFGLFVLALGSMLASMAYHIGVLLLARFLQGAGATGGALTAWVADLTRPEVRTRAMAWVGMSIGASFGFAFVLGPLFSGVVGVRGLFVCAAAMALLAIGLILRLPDPGSALPSTERSGWGALHKILRSPELMFLNAGIWMQHLLFASTFVALPLLWVQEYHIPSAEHWKIYAVALILSVPLAYGLLQRAERSDKTPHLLLGAVACYAFTQIALGFSNLLGVEISMTLFFLSFNILEAYFPSQISQVAPPELRGLALGVYAAFQFFGLFCGGVLGGWCLSYASIHAVFLCNGIAAMIWLLVVLWRAQSGTRHQ